jgi:hypothetical protein
MDTGTQGKGRTVDLKRMREILANLAGASREDLAAVLAWIDSRGAELATAAPSAEGNTELSELVPAKRSVVAELRGRQTPEQLAAARQAQLAELDGIHDPSRDNLQAPEGGTQPPTPKDVAGDDKPEGDKTDDKPGDDKPKADTKPEADKATKTTAKTTAKDRQLGALNPGGEGARQYAGTVVATTQVVGGIPGREAGSLVESDGDLYDALLSKATALNNSSAVGDFHVARTTFAYPEERQLTAQLSAEAATERIAAARGPEALTAAGLCLPLETRTEIATVGVTNRPIKEALSGFNTTRGGMQYRAPFDALVMSEGLGVWTQADDIAVDPADPETPRKTCFEVSCPGVLEASIYSTYLCLEFPNMGARFDRPWVEATTESASVAHARFAENQLLSRLLAGSKLVVGRHVAGAVRDLLYNFNRAIAYYRNRHRLDDSIPLHGIYPRWMIDMLQADLALQMADGNPAELFGIAKATLEAWFRTRNVNVTWHLDGLAGGTVNGVTIPNQFYANATAGATIPDFPAKVDSLLYREGDWLFLDGGTLDLGLVRDSDLNARNRYQTFMETFEGVAFVGIESLRVVFPLVPSGASVGTIDPLAVDATLPAVAA